MQELNEHKESLRALGFELGARAFGVADLTLLKETFPGLLDLVPGDYSRAIVVGCRLHDEVLQDIKDSPTPLYLHHYRQVNFQLDRIALELAGKLHEFGRAALTIPASQVLKNRPQTAHISHRLLGQAAGLGHIGRSGLLIHPVFGAHMRYVSVLTDMPLPADKMHEGDCGACRACIPACPAAAIGEKYEDFNLKLCHGKLLEFGKMPFIGQNICGVCVRVCRPRK